MEKKKSIDMHTNIATALLDQIKVGLSLQVVRRTLFSNPSLFISLLDSLTIFRRENLMCSLKWKTK